MLLSAQQNISYKELLLTASEVEMADSLHFNECPAMAIPVDSNTVRSIFRPLYHSAGKNWGNNVQWLLAGKITSYTNYDLLLLIEKNQGADSLCFNTLHLVTMGKEGDYIASFGLYIDRNSKTSRFKTSSFLFRDLSIIQKTKIVASSKKFGGTNEYKINEEGRFIHYAKN
jgi:hypothetical protein